MDEYKYYTKNEKKYNDFDYNDNFYSKSFNKNKVIDMLDDIKYNKYKEISSFTNLFSTSNTTSSRQQPTNPVTGPSSVQNQPMTFRGKRYDAFMMWSPQSFSGKIYQFNRGVIGVNGDGIVASESLDGTGSHHADATVEIVNRLGGKMGNRDDMPFQAGVDGANEGILVFQAEGDNAFVYFPEKITNEQLLLLAGILYPRRTFNYSFVHQEKIYEEQTREGVIEYARRISNELAVAARR